MLILLCLSFQYGVSKHDSIGICFIRTGNIRHTTDFDLYLFKRNSLFAKDYH